MGLTLDELNSIHSIFSWARQTESCADAMMEKEIEEGLKIIEREIKLKTIDPVTGKKIDVSGNPIFDGE